MNAIRGDAGNGDDEDVTPETLEMVASVRARAAGVPDASQIADLLSAPREGIAASPEQVRAMFAEAIRASQRVNYLLGVLSGTLGPAGGGDQ